MVSCLGGLGWTVCVTQRSLRQQHVCDALRGSVLNARYTAALDDSLSVLEQSLGQSAVYIVMEERIALLIIPRSADDVPVICAHHLSPLLID